MLTDSSRKFLQRTLTLEIIHLKKRGVPNFLNVCPGWDSNDAVVGAVGVVVVVGGGVVVCGE